MLINNVLKITIPKDIQFNQTDVYQYFHDTIEIFK